MLDAPSRAAASSQVATNKLYSDPVSFMVRFASMRPLSNGGGPWVKSRPGTGRSRREFASGTLTQFLHSFMPSLKMAERFWKLIVTAEHVVAEDAEEIEVRKTRTGIDQERPL